jgi:hypothetical protein
MIDVIRISGDGGPTPEVPREWLVTNGLGGFASATGNSIAPEVAGGLTAFSITLRENVVRLCSARHGRDRDYRRAYNSS